MRSEVITQVPMFSKMGKYISNKIFRYNQNSKRNKVSASSLPSTDSSNLKTQPDSQTQSGSLIGKIKRNGIKRPENEADQTDKHSKGSPKHGSIRESFQPPVGYYKVNYTQVEK